MKRPLILCPLGIEGRVIARTLRERAEVRVIGPGPGPIRDACEQAAVERPPLLVLFGLAGGLRDGTTAPRIGRVVDKDGRAWLVPVVPPGEEPAVTIVGMDEPVLQRARKHQMAGAYAAALVDTESHVFAACAADAGLRWAIIRGVSDGPNDELPAAVTEWVDALGRTRMHRVILGSILNPGVLPAVITLARRARPALRAASGRLLELLNTEADPGNPAVPAVVVASAGSSRNPIERQLGRKSARLNDPPPAASRER